MLKLLQKKAYQPTKILSSLMHTNAKTPRSTKILTPGMIQKINKKPFTYAVDQTANDYIWPRSQLTRQNKDFTGDPLPPQQEGPYEVERADFYDVQQWPRCQISGLENGLRVATESLPWNNSTVSIGVFVDAGARYENEENNGSAHFLEHLAFKGTAKRTREQLEVEVENLGGHLNAYTSREQTVYFAQVLKEDTEQAVDILSDILTASTLDPVSIDNERSTILQEMENVYGEAKEELIFDHLHENCFQDCALGRTILGPVDNIKRIMKQDLVEYISTYYTADNMVVVAVGAIDDHDKFAKLIEEKFNKLPNTNQKRPLRDESYFRGCDYEERWDDMDHVYCALAYETCSWNNADTYPLMFMQQMLGQWDKKLVGGQFNTSPLVRRLYEDLSRPIAENYMAFNTPYTDTGLFGVYGCCHPYDFKFFYDSVRREMNRFGYDITDGMIEDVRERLKATMLFSMGNTSAIMEGIGRELLIHGRRIHPSEAFSRVNDVDLNAIKYAAHKYLIDKDHAMVAVGPTHEYPFYCTIRQNSTKAY